MKNLFLLLSFTTVLFTYRLGAEEIQNHCETKINNFKAPFITSLVADMCLNAKQLDGCISTDGDSLFHFETSGVHPEASRILVIGGIHGDEAITGGILATFFQERLSRISPRNTWRIIPNLNPDGMNKKWRMNTRGVDLNRNFPTSDWDSAALSYWKKKAKSDPRRYPGESAASEVETKCLVKHIDDYKPDLIISVHTPYGVLDFDGPKIKIHSMGGMVPRRLGTFPGSLGRYMWNDRQVPVLTIEFKGTHPKLSKDYLEKLQDLTGYLALNIKKTLKK